MDEKKLVNISIAEYPTLNYSQVAPRPLLYMALGTMTAIFLACSAVYFGSRSEALSPILVNLQW